MIGDSKCPDAARRRALATHSGCVRSRCVIHVDALIENHHAAIANRLERRDVAALEPAHLRRSGARRACDPASCISVRAPGRSRAADSTSAARLLMLISVTGWPGRRTACALPSRPPPGARARGGARSSSIATDAIAVSAHRTSTRGHGRSPRTRESPFVDPDEPRRTACRWWHCRQD